MRVRVGDVVLYLDIDGCELVPDGDRMANRPTLVLLHGGPGADHTLFKPEFGAVTDTAQVIYLDQRGSGRSDVGSPEMWTWAGWAHCAARHPSLVAGLILDSTLGVPTTLDETLAVFERKGGRQARDAARRYLDGDM